MDALGQEDVDTAHLPGAVIVRVAALSIASPFNGTFRSGRCLSLARYPMSPYRLFDVDDERLKSPNGRLTLDVLRTLSASNLPRNISASE